ncbi:MAG: DegV family protein, partial [Chloroflexi bacterium]|nr:DegV family protein [Chloroflexota bacterium]
MAVKVITDRTSDLPSGITADLNISIVPIYVRFGENIYRQGIDISDDEFYARIQTSPVHPATSQPPPEDFIRVYSESLERSEQVVSIHVSSKLSGTHNSAFLARNMLMAERDIEIIDSKLNSAGLGLVAMAAARIAKAGGSLADVVFEANRAISQVKMFGMFNTMKYLALSGRVSKTIASAADILDVKPLLTFKDGQVARAGFVRTLSKGMERICQYVAANRNLM